MLDQWRRQIEADAAQHVQGAGLPQADVKPVIGPSPTVATEDKKLDAITRHRESDAFEADQVNSGQQRRYLEASKADGAADGELVAGQHLRLHHKADAPKPTQSLMTTLASQRKEQVRTRRRVAQAGGKKTSTGFTNLPHAGLWKAQPLPSKGTPLGKQPATPRVRAQITVA